MNVEPNSLSPEELRLLDRLVDGELDEPARRRLLLALEDRAGGWRDCALAFLEAQNWRTDLGEFVGQQPIGVPGDARLPLAPATRNGAGAAGHWSWSGMAALAAMVLVAVTLGAVVGSRWSTRQSPAPDAPAVASVDDWPVVPPPEASEFAEFLPSDSTFGTEEEPFDDSLTLVVDGDETAPPRRYRVPLVNESVYEGRVPQGLIPSLPESLIRQLEAAGHRVQTQRRYAPMELSNGRQLVVPVDDVQIVPVSRPIY